MKTKQTKQSKDSARLAIDKAIEAWILKSAVSPFGYAECARAVWKRCRKHYGIVSNGLETSFHPYVYRRLVNSQILGRVVSVHGRYTFNVAKPVTTPLDQMSDNAVVDAAVLMTVGGHTSSDPIVEVSGSGADFEFKNRPANELTDGEITAIIAALRMVQVDGTVIGNRYRRMNHFDGGVKPPTDEQIDALCEFLNLGA